MHVTSEDGIFTFRKTLRKQPKLHDRIDFIDSNVDESEPAVCGIYFMADPDKLVEVEIEFSDVSCELGGLLGVITNLKTFLFVDFIYNSNAFHFLFDCF